MTIPSLTSLIRLADGLQVYPVELMRSMMNRSHHALAMRLIQCAAFIHISDARGQCVGLPARRGQFLLRDGPRVLTCGI